MKEKFYFTRFGIGFLISLLCTSIGVFVAPIAFDIAIEQNILQSIILVFLSIFLGLTIFIVIALGILRKQQEKCTVKQAVLKTSCLGGIYVLCCFMFSLLFGLIATVFYFMLENSLSFDQIKGIINLVTAFIVLLVLPFFISVFWTVMKNNKRCLECCKYGLKLPYKVYLKLVITVVLWYGMGIIITTIFQFVPYSIVFRILKTVVLAIVGGMGFVVTELICQYKGGEMR